jgi:hypothetical protein
MEANTDKRASDTSGVEITVEGNNWANYYPGMLADLEDQESECRDRMFEQEFFDRGECDDIEE